MPSDSDRLLVQQIRAGDSRAWDGLIARYEGRLLAFVDRRLRDRAASEDVVQETFIGFLNSLPNYDEERELQTYLFTIASHKLTDHLRRMGRHPLRTVSDSRGDSDLLQQQFDRNPAASSLARSQERRDLESGAVGDSLNELLGNWRDKNDYQRIKVMELLLVKGWANREVAAFLNISEQQVANYRFAAVKKLGERIRERGLSSDVFPELQEPRA
jgi:RNA polymerase sigma-70 factor (ECF subfamily)